MTRFNLSAVLLGATALSLPMAMQANAQAAFVIDRERPCIQLSGMIDEVGEENLREEFLDAPLFVERQDIEGCVVVLEEVLTVGTIGVVEAGAAAVATETETFRETEQLTETVTIEQQAIVQGEVLVRQQVPTIDIEQTGAAVEVTERPVGVTIDEQPADIMVRQRPANVRVAIARPTVTIEQPAPEIIITMPAPGVAIDQVEPDVNVVMTDPTVTVTQPDPEVSVNVEAELVAGDELAVLERDGTMPEVATRVERLDATGAVAQREAEVAIVKAKPTVRFVATQTEPEYTFNRINPRVTYEPAEPNIEVMFNEEPRVEIRQVGEPRVQIRRAGEVGGAVVEEDDEALLLQQEENEVEALGTQAAMAVGEGVETVGEGVEAVGTGIAAGVERTATRLSLEDTNRFLAAEEGYEIGEAERMSMMAGDLRDADVYTMRGEEVGEVEQIAAAGGQLYAIISHGGFLGIGENEVAIPLERLAMRGDEVILLGLTEEQLEQMPNYDFDADQEYSATEPVEIGRFE